MGQRVDLDDLCDTQDVAEIIGLSSATAVGTYRRRYDDFPDPVWTSRGGRCQLWLREDIEAWAAGRGG